VSLSFGDLFQAEITLDERSTALAEEAVRRAAEERGESVDVSPVQDTSTRLARVLWVDDNPDNNFYETVALERLGRFVTKTTSTSAALRYLAELPFSLVITDVGRGGDHGHGKVGVCTPEDSVSWSSVDLTGRARLR
jgi:PleD family two-component response regulator